MNPILSSHDDKVTDFKDKWNSGVSYHNPKLATSESPDHMESDFSLNEIINNFFPKPDQSSSELCSNEERSEDKFAQIIYLRPWKYDHKKLASQVQDLLNCLAPFTSIINLKGLERYVTYLKKQPALADLPFDLCPEVIQGVINQGLLWPDPGTSVLLHADPKLPYFLKTSLYMFERSEKRQGVETAFREYYEDLAVVMYQLMESNKEDEKELGEFLIRPEYENFVTALELSLNARVSVINIYRLLSNYLKANENHESALALGKMVLDGLNSYPREKLSGSSGAEFVAIADDIARDQLAAEQYSEAERSYQTALAIWLQNQDCDADQIRRKSSSIYHQLGRVALEQCQWERAREYFLKSLEISKKYNDLREMPATLRNLHRLWKESGDEELPGDIAMVLGWNA